MSESIEQLPVIQPAKPALNIAPTNMEEALKFASILAKSNLVPKDYRGKEGDVLVAMQWGAEIGLQPMQALQNIAVINGRPSIWGDAAIALAYAHPKCESIEETIIGEGDNMVARCTAKRRGQPPTVREFSVKEAKEASLWGRNTWANYPKRMLQMRARGFALRDAFPDALKGLQLAEEVEDLPPEPEKEVVGGTHRHTEQPENRDDALAQKLGGDTAQAPSPAPDPADSPADPASLQEPAAPEAGGSIPDESPPDGAQDSISEAISRIETVQDGNDVQDIINTSDLGDDQKRMLRGLTNAKIKQVTAQG